MSMKILIAEPEAPRRRALARGLRGDGWRIVTARDRAEMQARGLGAPDGDAPDLAIIAGALADGLPNATPPLILLGTSERAADAPTAAIRLTADAPPRTVCDAAARLLADAGGGAVTPSGAAPGATGCGPKTGLGGAVETQLRAYFQAHEGGLPAAGLHSRVWREIETALMRVTLEATGGNQRRAAEILGLSRNTLRRRLRELDIDPAARLD